MNLKSLRLINFCPHHDLKLEFNAGVTGIFGHNGAGKSSIMRALLFVLLGDSGNDGAKIDDLNWQAHAAGEHGSVELDFEHNGIEGTIKRELTRATASYSYGAVRKRRVSDVNDAILKLISLPVHTISEVVFVMQGKIESLLFSTPAEQKKQFHALFGIDKAEPLRELLRKEIATLGVVADTGERLAAVKQQLDEQLDPQLREYVQQQTAWLASLGQLDRAAADECVRAYDVAQSRATDVAQLQSTITASEQRLVAIRVDEGISAVDTMTAELESARKRAEELRLRRNELASAAKLSAVARQLQARIRDCEQRLLVAAPTAPAFTLSDVQVLERERMDVNNDIAPKRSFIQAFKDVHGTIACPTCLQPVSEPDKLVALFKQEVAEKAAALVDAQQMIEQCRSQLAAYEHDVKTHAAQLKTAQADLDKAQRELAELGDAPAVTEDITQLDAALAAVTKQAQELANSVSAARTQAAQAQALAGELVALKRTLQDAIAAQTTAPSDAAVASARQQLAAHEALTADIAAVGGKITQLQAQRASLLEEIAQLEDRANKQTGLKHYHELCERTRGLLHYDCLPQVAVRAYLGKLNSTLNEYLQTFGAPFACTVHDDLSMVYAMPGSGTHSVRRLSGGQRVILGIAFRFAIYSLFASDLGFMLLDEPTVMLDKDRIDSVADVLERVRQHVHNTGKQIVVITHDGHLCRAFDATIDV